MAARVSLVFELFEEVLADDLPQEQVLLGADEGAVLFLFHSYSSLNHYLSCLLILLKISNKYQDVICF